MDTRMNIPVALVRELVSRARLAPSTHNTQPWSWSVVACPDDPGLAGALELNQVPERGLPLGDPGGRELVASCGAALLTLRVAAAEHLVGTRVDALPDPARPDLLARVLFVQAAVDAAFSGLDAAVPVRHTWRRDFTARRPPAALLARLGAEAAAEGARLHLLAPDDVPELAALVRAADRDLSTDRERRAELARWLRPRWGDDGVTRSAVGVLPARLALRGGLAGRRSGARDAALLLAAPAVGILFTAGEGRADWLAAGQSLQRLLLVAAGEGLAAGFANGPCQDSRHRASLAALLDAAAFPQFVLRLGYPPTAARPLPRRSLDDVLVWPAPAPAGVGPVPVPSGPADPGEDAGDDQLG